MTLDQVRFIHTLLAEGKDRWVDAANAILYLSEIQAVVENHAEAVSVIQKFKQTLLDSDNYKMAATLLWGTDMFNVEPDCVSRVFNALHDNALVLLMGAASVSKTYSCGAWMLLDWMRDPAFTTIKVISRDEGHLKTNLFAHIWSLFKASVIPLTDNDDANVIYRESELYIGLKAPGPYYGFHGIAVKHSSDSTGDLKGFKPKPMRLSDHPRYGRMSRLRVMADESQNIPAGVFKDFGSLQGSLQGKDLVKIAMAFNPEDMGRTVVQMAEPQQGWLEEDVERLYDWESKQGWHVTRLDGARSENVVAKKVVYPGIQTYEGFLSYLKGDGSDSSSTYYCFGRGWPPLKGSANTIIPASWPNEQRGEAVWLDKPTMGASIDLAFQGADTAQMTIFKWGRAKGWRRANGKYEEFVDRTSPSRKKPRHVLEITQIIQMEKSHDSIQASEEIMGRCNILGIKPEWVVVDKSGVGLGTYSHLTKYWGNVLGIGWGDGATDLKVLSEDAEFASTRFMGVMSEMWFAFREWLNPAVCAIIINPIIPTTPLNIQLTARRFRYAKNNTMKVESKDEYKARNQRSPDEADSVIMAVQLVRQRGRVLPGMVEQEDSRVNRDPSSETAELDNADEADSVCADGTNGSDSL